MLNKSEYPNADVAAGEIDGFHLLDEYGVYRCESRENAVGKSFVDTTWAIQPGNVGLKCRLVGREYKWASKRTDVFAAASNPTMGRIIDYLAMKDSDESDPLVTWIADAVNAYYQVPETEEFHVDRHVN